MEFRAKKGRRLCKEYFGIEVPDSDVCWWIRELKKWATIQEVRESGKSYSNFCRCNTVRAFRRHLKWYGVKGTKYILVSKYVGYDVSAYAKGRE